MKVIVQDGNGGPEVLKPGTAADPTAAAGRILIRQKVTQSDLAAMAGIARENVSRILNEWMRKKIVSRLAGYYCLENRSALEREAEM